MTTPPLVRTERPARIPLSDAQRRFWLVHHSGGSRDYHLPEALRLRGALDLPALHAAMNAVVARHEILRTRLVDGDDGPQQVVEPSVTLAMPVEEFTGREECVRTALVDAALREEWERPFDLAVAPLMRARVLKFADNDHALVRTFHHVVFDDWSRAVFNHDVEECYASLRGARTSTLAPLDVQYADFAVWEQAAAAGGALDAALAYWRGQLAGCPEQVDLPAHRSHDAARGAPAHRYAAMLPRAVEHALQQVCQTHRVTPYIVLLSAFAALLSRYTQQDDLVIGSPVASRPDPAVTELIGPFINLLPIRIQVPADANFSTLVASVRHTLLDAFDHRDVSFDRIAAQLGPSRGDRSFVNVAFNLLSTPRADVRLDGLDIERVVAAERRLAYDVEVYVTREDGMLRVTWAYNSALLSGDCVERLANHYVRLLEQVLANPGVAIADIALAAPAESARLVAEWSRALPLRPVDGVTPVVRNLLLERPPASDEDAAIRCGELTLTYGELHRRSRAIAKRLRDAGARGDLVGISVTTRVDAVVAIVGALKAGCGFVPLDRRLPAERVRAMVEQCDLHLLVTDDMLRSIEASDGVDVSAEMPVDPAYVYFTSGSTGTPKGIAGRLIGLEHFIDWEIDALRVGHGTRVSQLTGIGFDPFLRDIFLPLCSGGTLCIPADDAIAHDGCRLVEWLDEQRVEVVHCVPTVLRLILQHVSPARRLERLRWVLVAGEPLLPADVKRWFAVMPRSAQLVNVYGPTETTLAKLVHLVTRRDEGRRSIPIGRPIRGSAALVLDSRGRPCPPGVVGEIYIATPYRSLGYYRQPETTADAFVPSPFGEIADVMYRTGDLGRVNDIGEFEFVGRRDGQVKIRGSRVELGEIESALLDQPGVTGAAATVRADAHGASCLAAYFTGAADSQQLRTALSRRLPGWMVPNVVVRLDTIPLSPNGKVNRGALPEPASSARRPVQAPRSPAEATLCAIFADVLDLEAERVGATDDFFELGGHSLTAMQLANRVRAAFGVELPLAQLFEMPSVRELASCLATCTAAQVQP